jgi:2-C-methyl-D-erythritol 2,4-cyclodiphosphate synthase
VDVTLIAERPKLAPHIPAMREKLAAALGLSVEHVSVKAKTNEGMGAIGRGEGMAALAIASLREISSREEIS